MIRIAILGAGRIAGTMAATLRDMKEKNQRYCCYAVAAREGKRAEAFAGKYGFEKAYGSYEEMLSDENVDLVYIATPHSHHFTHIKMCLEHGKHVLCEKAFTVNAEQAREVIAIAEERHLLLAEAIWTRYMPMRDTVSEVLESGVIGRPFMLTANLCYRITNKERIVRPELAGGALLDVGIYPLNFAVMAFGNNITGVESSVQMLETGVDAQENITLKYTDGRMAALTASACGISDRKGMIYGEEGFLEVENINNPQSATIYNKNYRAVKTILCPPQVSGYEYEVLGCLDAIEAGKTECEKMSHSEIIRMMELMDEIRGQWGLVYPCE